MELSFRSLAPAAWLRLPRRTARLRLTLLFATMFLLLGTAVIVVTYLLEREATTVHVRAVGPAAASSSARASAGTLTAVATPQGADPRKRYVAGVVTAQHNADIGRLLEISWAVLAVTTIGAALLGWFAAGRVLAPVREMTATAQTISAGNLHERLALAGPDDEFKRLGDTLDNLLGRLEASFEAQRRFVAHASHELRTPLTVERTLIQVALANRNATMQSLRGACEELLVSQSDHERLLESLLTLATSERGLEHRELIDLSVLAERALETPRPRARPGIEITTEFEPAPAVGDPALMQRLIANLVDNAVDHNVDGGWVTIQTGVEEDESLFSVSNAGPLVSVEGTDRLFEPFQRLDDRQRDANGHHGLGLSIVQAIVIAHGGTISAVAQPAGGLTVVVRLAKAPKWA